MEPDRNGVGADAEDLGDLVMAELLPRDETQQLLVVWPKAFERGNRWSGHLPYWRGDAS